MRLSPRPASALDGGRRVVEDTATVSIRPARRLSPTLLAALLAVALLADAATWAAEPRPETWAKPLNRPGLSNLHQVTPTLYRGAQPGRQGMKTLEAMGVKTVINLRHLHSDKRLLAGTSLHGVHIEVNTLAPEHAEIVAFLKAVTDPAAQPVFVHCQHGADRTGLMIAMYRLAVQGWSKDEALRELRQGGYNFHSIWKHIPRIIERIDVAALRQEAGLPEPVAGLAR